MIKKIILKFLKTKDLHNELITRSGVETYFIEPYESKNIKAEGPATVFVIID